MKAVVVTRPLPIDDPGALVDTELEPPEARGRDLLVRVKAISVNPVDTKVRMRETPGGAPRVLGWDAAGIVEAAGEGARLFQPGDAVYYAGSIARPGANSELHAVDERIVGHKPASLGFAEAAALPLTALTAWEGLFDRMGIAPEGGDAGRTLLVIGGAGGVGSIAIQLAKRLARLRVVATASRPESASWARELGADEIVDHSRDLAPQLPDGVDFILCASDTDAHFPAFAGLIRPQGRICSIVGTKAPVALGALMAKSVTFAWELMFTRPVFGTPDIERQHAILEEVASLVDAGTLRTTLRRIVGPIDAAHLRAAHRELEQGHVVGKLVLEGF